MGYVAGFIVLVMPVAALLVVVGPPSAMWHRHRWPASSVALWLLGSLLVAGWTTASNSEMDRVDATGGSGNAFTTVGWLVAALASAAAAWLIARSQRPDASVGHSWSGM